MRDFSVENTLFSPKLVLPPISAQNTVFDPLYFVGGLYDFFCQPNELEFLPELPLEQGITL